MGVAEAGNDSILNPAAAAAAAAAVVAVVGTAVPSSGVLCTAGDGGGEGGRERGGKAGGGRAGRGRGRLLKLLESGGNDKVLDIFNLPPLLLFPLVPAVAADVATPTTSTGHGARFLLLLLLLLLLVVVVLLLLVVVMSLPPFLFLNRP